MDTSEFKNLIGQDCLVIDPRSKKKVFQEAKIKSVCFVVQKFSDEVYERFDYTVELYKTTYTKKNRYGEEYAYHRQFTVSGDRIRFF